MWDEQEPISAPPLSLEPAQLLQIVGGPSAGTWIGRLSTAERDQVTESVKRALVEAELAGNYTSADLLAGYHRLGGHESELDDAVLSAAASRRDQLTQGALSVVWVRLGHVQDRISEAEVRSWLREDMIRGLAAQSVTWTRFAAIVLGDWARKHTAGQTETSLAERIIARHPSESAAVLAQAIREDPHGAERLVARLEASHPRTLVSLAAAVVDDGTIPAGLRVTLAGRAGESVRARARDMVARELGVSEETLGALAPEQDDGSQVTNADGTDPATLRLAWAWAGVAFLIAAMLSPGLRFAVGVALIFFVVAWVVGRSRSDEDD